CLPPLCLVLLPLFFSMLPPPPRSTLFPYTTLFRSVRVSPRVQTSQRSAEDVRRGVPPHRRPISAQVHVRRSHERGRARRRRTPRSEEHTSELQSRRDLVCRLLLEKKKKVGRKECRR